MAKANIVEKKTISIKGILNIDESVIVIETEDGDIYPLADVLKNFNGADVSMSVAETNEIA